MFKHGKTGKIYYSVREKINYYSKIVNGNVSSTPELKAKAEKRLPELQKINNQSYDEPKIIITDDKFFGNPISKPRAAVVVRFDKDRLFVAPMQKTTSKQVVFDKDCSRQISKTSDGKNKWISCNDVYEEKYLSSLIGLTKYDIEKIKNLYK